MSPQSPDDRWVGPPSAGGIDDLLGLVVDGRYQVLSVLGEGGMGVVYRVRHAALGREFALKILKRELARDEQLAERFLREAQSAAAVRHPQICEITDFGRLEGRPYFVMELLAGEALRTILGREGRLPLARLLQIAVRVVDAMGAAHEAGVVHRDLKPENILVDQSVVADDVKIVDFGLACIAGKARLTRPGLVYGTPHYMSPEQVTGGEVGAASDIYAMGVVLFEMCVGQVPFIADTYMGVLSQHLHNAPPVVSVAAGEPDYKPLDAIVSRCLAKEPSQRFSAMAEVSAALRAIQSGMPLVAPVARAQRARRPHRAGLWWVVLLGLAAGVGAVLAMRDVLGLVTDVSPAVTAPGMTAEPVTPHALSAQVDDALVGQPPSQSSPQENETTAVAPVAGSASAVGVAGTPVSKANGERVNRGGATHAPAKSGPSKDVRASKSKGGPFRRTNELVNPWSK